MSTKVVTVRSSDGETFQVDEKLIILEYNKASSKHVPEPEDEDEDGTVLSSQVVDGITEYCWKHVPGKVLAKVIDYCVKHANNYKEGDDDEVAADEEEDHLKDWDAEFIGNVDLAGLYRMIITANKFHIKGLLDLSCKTLLDRTNGTWGFDLLSTD